jgi:PTS system nitrogen regulatory IIA component
MHVAYALNGDLYFIFTRDSISWRYWNSTRGQVMDRSLNAGLIEGSCDQALQSLCPKEIALHLDLRNKRRALEVASTLVECSLRLGGGPVLRALLRREEAGSTALGAGIAIPHARISGIERPVTVFLRGNSPIPFDAPDGKPVSDILVILVPADGATEEHLRLLARVAEMFSDRAFRALLCAATEPSAVWNVFAQWIAERTPVAVEVIHSES